MNKNNKYVILIITFILDIIGVVLLFLFNKFIVAELKALDVYINYKTIILVINDLIGLILFSVSTIGLFLFSKSLTEK